MSQEYIVADSRELVKEYSRRNIHRADIIITSPPYFDSKTYDKVESQIGYKQSYQEYLCDTSSVLQHCYSVSSDDATLWVVVDTIKRNGVLFPIPFDIQRTLIEGIKNDDSDKQTWILRDIIVWNRSKNIPWNSKGHLKHEFEYILCFSKNQNYKYYLNRIRNVEYSSQWWLSYPERYNPNGRPPSNVWDFVIPIRGWGNGYQQHLCPLPFPLIERILSLSTDEGDYVLDPFAGSGSVMALAGQMGRNAVGFDISENYKNKYETQVLTGAQNYWQERTSEVELEQERAANFKETNIKLRKIKSGIKLAKTIKRSLNDDSAVYVIVDGDHLNISLLVLQNQIESKITYENYIDDLKKIEREYYININILYKPKSERSITEVIQSDLFLYTSHRIYRNSGTFSISQIINGTFKPSHVFADINVNIQNSNDS